MAEWQRLRLKGKEQAMPEYCPNCMGPSAHRFRYGYKGWKGALTNTTYYQTFYYCEPCMNQTSSALGLRWWTMLGIILGVIAWVALLVTLSDTWRDPETHRVPDAAAAMAMILSVAGGALVAFLVRLAVKAIKQKRHPLRAGQAIWGPAAFYAGSGFLDAQNLAAYRAVRREWLAELVRLNPQQVDEATYQAWVGQPRPAAAPTSRPFGG